MKKMKTKMIGIKRCGYTPYGYGVRINNRLIEFATESELDEWIGEDDYGFIYDTQVCILGSNKSFRNIREAT